VRSCGVSIQTDENNMYKATKGQHDIHLPDPERIELLGFKQKVKDPLTKETTSITGIYDQELAAANLSPVALALAPLAKDERESLSFSLVYLFNPFFRTFCSSTT
jgi:hypothetical protein